MKNDALLRIRVPKESLAKWESAAASLGVKFPDYVRAKMEAKVGSEPPTDDNTKLVKDASDVPKHLPKKPKEKKVVNTRFTGEVKFMLGAKMYQFIDDDNQLKWTPKGPKGTK